MGRKSVEFLAENTEIHAKRATVFSPQMKEQNSTTEVNNEIKCKQLNGSKTIKQINKMK